MNNTESMEQTEYFSRRLSEPFSLFGEEIDPNFWYVIVGGVLLLGFVYIAWMYLRDARRVGLGWAVLLGSMRAAVYLILAWVFMLPAKQDIQISEKRSKVVIAIDVSPSIIEVSDDPPTSGSDTSPSQTRFDRVVSLLTDEDVTLLKKLTEKNPVSIYRFGGRAEAEPLIFTGEQDSPTAEQWQKWARYDFKEWVLADLSPEGRDALEKWPAFVPDQPGDSNWAIGWISEDLKDPFPPSLSPEDLATAKDRRSKLGDRVDVARLIASGTDIGGSLLSIVNREANDMLQGMIVLSDGRNTIGSDASMTELRTLADDRKIPIFTITVGEDRPQIAIRITDVQAPNLTPPDEAFKVYVEVDGEGLPGEDAEVSIDLTPPDGDEPAFTFNTTVQFRPGEPPHAQAEFVLDPDDERIPEAFTRPSKEKGTGRDFIEGQWLVTARVPADQREFYPEPEHVSEPPTRVNILSAPLRVLLVGSGPVRDFQFLRTLLVREGERAELSIFLQNEGGYAGEIVADVDPNRVLTRFPDHLDLERFKIQTPEERPYNLAAYDLILAFDPDWSRVGDEQIRMLDKWIDDAGGGLIYVAGPINTGQLARERDERIRPLLDALPVEPGDNLIQTIRRSTDKPWRLRFPGASPDTDFLKLDDKKDGPLAGWELFFTNKEEPPTPGDITTERGFYNVFPIKKVKAGAASIVARFTDPASPGPDGEGEPFLVTMQAGQGRTVWIGSSEMYRLRAYEQEYYERFWLKLFRFASAGSRKKQDRRGRLLVSDEFTQRGIIRIQAQLLDAQLQPLPDSASPKMTITRLGPDADRYPVKPFQMAARKTAGEWDGMFQRQLTADPKEFPAGEYRLDVEIPGSAESLNSTFRVVSYDPELDNTRPDFENMRELATSFDDVADRIQDESVRREFRTSLGGSRKLAFRVDDRAVIALIPACIDQQIATQKVRGRVEDLWDQGPTLGKWLGYDAMISWVLLLVVGLLSAEWLIRKLLRLA